MGSKEVKEIKVNNQPRSSGLISTYTFVHCSRGIIINYISKSNVVVIIILLCEKRNVI